MDAGDGYTQGCSGRRSFPLDTVELVIGSGV